jgi:hypothetical protein
MVDMQCVNSCFNIWHIIFTLCIFAVLLFNGKDMSRGFSHLLISVAKRPHYDGAKPGHGQKNLHGSRWTRYPRKRRKVLRKYGIPSQGRKTKALLKPEVSTTRHGHLTERKMIYLWHHHRLYHISWSVAQGSTM